MGCSQPTSLSLFSRPPFQAVGVRPPIGAQCADDPASTPLAARTSHVRMKPPAVPACTS